MWFHFGRMDGWMGGMDLMDEWTEEHRMVDIQMDGYNISGHMMQVSQAKERADLGLPAGVLPTLSNAPHPESV